MRQILAAKLLLLAGLACAASPEDFLQHYAAQAKQGNPSFAGFSATRGETFYLQTHRVEGIGEISCASCHHVDPRKGTRAHEEAVPCRACHVMFSQQPESHRPTKHEILPLAPSANPNRFTSESSVEYWFGYNCKVLLGRECTPQEKGDIITWLLSLR